MSTFYSRQNLNIGVYIHHLFHRTFHAAFFLVNDLITTHPHLSSFLLSPLLSSLSLLHSQPSNMDVATGSEGLVVEEVLPIVHIGTTLLYERTLTEEDGKIPFEVRKLPATEIAIIMKSTDPLVFVDGSKVRRSIRNSGKQVGRKSGKGGRDL